MLSTYVLSFTLVGCTSSKFDSSYKQFKESYVLATDFLETSNDSLKGLKNMDENLVKTEFEKMKDSMDKMSTELNSKDEKGIYSNVEGYYDMLPLW